MSATLVTAWREIVSAAPTQTAVTEAGPGRVWTRRDLDVFAFSLQQSFPASLTDRTVVLAAPNSGPWLGVFAGLIGAGAAVAPLDAGEPADRQVAIAEAIGASFLWREGQLIPLRLRRPHRDGRRVIKLTSGSTGTPRAIAFTDAEMLADGCQVASSMGIRSSDTNYALIPFGHSYGLGNLVVPLLAQGTAIICGSAALPHVIADEMARFAPTIFPTVPALLRALASADIPAERLRSLRTVISAGAPLAPEVARAFHAKFDLKVHSFYGSTETGGITYDRSGDAALTGRSVGTPLDGVSLAFSAGRRFEVISPAVYTIHNRRRRGPLGAHRPADLAVLTTGGELQLIARTGRLVKIAGRRVNLTEIERALREIDDVRDALVMPDPERADALAAAVATERAPAELRTMLSTRLPSWKIPRRIVAVSEFPLTARGKTDLRRVQALLKFSA